MQKLLSSPGELKYRHGRVFSSKMGVTVHYRSSYELLAIGILDASDRVRSFEVEAIAIPYKHNGKSRHYIPDFVINGRHILEVKPLRRAREEINRIKFRAGRRFAKRNGMTFRVWTEKDVRREIAA